MKVSHIVLARISSTVESRARVQLAMTLFVLIALGAVSLRRAPVRDLVTLHFLGPPRVDEYRNGTVFDFTESYLLAAYLKDRTTRDEPVQIWGYESLTYYLADRFAASRFQMTHPLVMRPPGGALTPMQRRWREEFIRDVGGRKPPYVVVVREDHWWWAPGEQSSEQLLDDFPEWKGLIQRDYSLETTIGRFLVYRRR